MSYQGEQLNPADYLQALEQAGMLAKFKMEIIDRVGSYPIYWMERRPTAKPAHQIYLSAGVHGDEPAAPLAILQLIKKGLLDPFQNVHWFISPLLNPTGFENNSRENHHRIDLNRDFTCTQSVEVKALKNQLQSMPPVDLALMIHEDWESKGFYLYDLASNPSRDPASMIIKSVATEGPIDDSTEIDEMNAENGIIFVDPKEADKDPKLDGNWPEALYLNEKRLAAFQYTIEAPSSLNLEQRSKILQKAIISAIESVMTSKR